MGGVPTDVLDRGIQIIDDTHTEVERHVFGAPVVVGRGDRSGKKLTSALITVDDDSGSGEFVENWRNQPFCRRRMHQKSFHGVADARALDLRVVHDIHRPLLVGAFVEKHVHDPGPCLDYRHRRLTHDSGDEVGAPPRDENVDQAPGPHQPGSAVAPEFVDALNGVGGQTDRGDRIPQHRYERAVAVLGSRPSSKHDRVAALQREGRDVDGDVGPSFVDRPDHAEGHTRLADAHTVRQGASPDDLAHRIGESRDLIDRIG